MAAPHMELIDHAATGISVFRVKSAGRPNMMETGQRPSNSPDSLMISSGSGKAAIGRLGGSPFRVAADKAVRATFIPQGADAEITYDSTARAIGINFPTGYLARAIGNAARAKPIDPFLFQHNSALVELSRTLEAEIVDPGFASDLLIEGLAHAIIANLARFDHGRLTEEADRIYLAPWKLRRVIDYIESNLGNDIRLSDLAGVAGLSMFHFARVFKYATGLTPYHFVRDRRIAHGRELLADGNLDLCELARRCGFASQSHFTAAFTKAVGISPGRYRRDHHRQLP